MTTAATRVETNAATWHDAEDLRWAVRHWAARIRVKPPQVHVREMTTKWASMSTSGRLTLNSELLGLPKRLGEYVIVHELLHLIAPNHGKVFKSFLTAYLPDWRERDMALRVFSLGEAPSEIVRE
jgi:predicted metal-dependent hydrolase